MFLYSASVTWFATHLTPCIINFASQLTRCVIIFASRFGLCILITVCSGPRGRLQLGGAGSRCWPALAPSGAAWCRQRAQGCGRRRDLAGLGGSRAGTAADTLPLAASPPDPNLTPLPSSAPLQPCPSSFNCSHSVSQPPAFVAVPDTLPRTFISPWLCSLCSPNNLRGARKFFVQLQLGGCFSRMPWKNYLT